MKEIELSDFEDVVNKKNFKFGWKTIRNDESIKKIVEFGPISRGDVGQTFQWKSGNGVYILHDYLNKGIWLTIDNKIYDATTEECSMAVSDIFYDDGFDEDTYEGIEDASDPMYAGASPTLEETIAFLERKKVLSASYTNCEKETFLTLFTDPNPNIYSAKYINDIEKIARLMMKSYSSSYAKYKLQRDIEKMLIKKDNGQIKDIIGKKSTLSIKEHIEMCKKKLLKYKKNTIEYIKSYEALNMNTNNDFFL